jgi:tripeptide aminopeptidase
VEARGGVYRTMTTFIGSDSSALRASMRVFTVSTGVMDEHTVEEWVPLAPLAELAETAVALLARLGWAKTRAETFAYTASMNSTGERVRRTHGH